MATLVEAPRAAHNVTSTRPRAVVPIIPVIPRSLQSKRKSQPVLKPLTTSDSSKDAASSNKQPLERDGGPPPALEGSAPGSDVNGDIEGRRNDNLSNDALNPLEKATDCKSTTHRASLADTDLCSDVCSVFWDPRLTIRFNSDREYPVGHNLDCRPPFDKAAYMMPAPVHPVNHFPIPSSMAPPTLPFGPPGLARNTPPHSHESSGNIVFGGFPGSGGPSPVLPPSPSAMTFLPRSFPNWAPSQSPQHFSNPHPQHVHGPHPNWHGHFAQYAHQQPNMYDPQRQSYALPPGYYHRMPSFVPPDNHFPYTPPPGTPFVNSFQHAPQSKVASFSGSSIGSHSASGSVDSSALRPAQPKASVSYGGPSGAPEHDASQPRVVATDEDIQQTHLRDNAQLRADSAAQQNGKVITQELDSVSNYLLSQFNCKALSDCCLRLSHSHNNFKGLSLYLHRLVIARSPLLASLMSFAATDADGFKQIHLDLTGNHFRPDAFELALLHLYGEPLLDHESLVARDVALPKSSMATQDKSRSSNTVSDCLEVAIGYATAGDILHLPAVKRRGEEIASKLISWETLERGMTFAIDAKRSTEKAAADLAPFSHPSSCAASRKSSSCSTASRNSNKENSAIRIPCDPPNRGEPHHARSTYGTPAAGLLQDICQYIGTNFPSDFQLQTLTPSLPTIDRLPTTAELSLFSHPGLSSIQFGEHPSEEAERPNPQTFILSQILLSVPFPVLNLIFEHLTPDTQGQHARSIIGERERRRDRALRSKSVPWASRLAEGAQWHEVGWEESVGVEPTEAGRNVRLARRWTGLRRTPRTRARRV